jgi:phytoene dehydrogenase-like protein
MTDFEVVVIGAGNGGLAASLTLAKAGVKTLLLERHNIPGGCATSFVRGRFEFEVALHQLSGVGTEEFPGPLKHTFNDLGITDDIDLVQMENLYRAVSPGNFDVTLKADKADSIDALKTKFPHESENIERFFNLVWSYCDQWVHIMFMRDSEASPAKYPLYFKYALKPMQDVLDEFINDLHLQIIIGMYWSYLGIPPSKLPFGEFAVVLWAYTEFKPWHIKGGSQALSNAILNSFLSHGGEVKFNCAVKKIKTENGKVCAIITEQGEEFTTERIISNAGTYTTYVELLDEAVVPESRLNELGARSVGVSAVSVFIGFDAEPHELGIREATNFLTTTLDHNTVWQDCKTLNPSKSMLFTCFDVDDPDFSPKGACQGALISLAYSDPWLKIPPTQYFETKYNYAESMLTILNQIFPNCRDCIEEIEVGTPLTHMRYLGHPGGAIYGFDQWIKDTELFINKRSPIKGLYHAGAWIGSGGFQPTLMSGASAARAVIRSLK